MYIIVETMARVFGLARSAVKDRSILMPASGRLRMYESEEYPVPKSSRVKRIPYSISSSMIRTA